MIPASHGCGAASARKSAVIINGRGRDRKSTRLNSSHSQISYAVFCLKKKKYTHNRVHSATPYPRVAARYATARVVTNYQSEERRRLLDTRVADAGLSAAFIQSVLVMT